MAESRTYATIGEKYEDITKGKRSMPGMIWVTNEEMNARLDGNFVLMEIQAKQFASETNAFRKQGYTKYNHAKAVAPPVEAKQTAKPESKT